MDAAQIKAAHDPAYFDTYGNGSAFDQQRVTDARKRIAWIGPGDGDLLEIGSAAGHFLVEAQKAGYRPVGVEQSVYAIEHGVAQDIPVHAELVEDAPLEPESFDVVCAFHVIEHLRDPVGVLSHLRDLLRPGGRIYLEVPNFGGARSKRMGADWPYLMPEHHRFHFTTQSIRIALQQAGFGGVQTETLMPMAYLPVSKRLQPRKLAQWAKYTTLARTVALHHPERHDLLRATAVR